MVIPGEFDCNRKKIYRFFFQGYFLKINLLKLVPKLIVVIDESHCVISVKLQLNYKRIYDFITLFMKFWFVFFFIFRCEIFKIYSITKEN